MFSVLHPDKRFSIGTLVASTSSALRGIVVEAYADLDLDTLKRKEIRDILWENGEIETCVLRAWPGMSKIKDVPE